MQPLQPNDYHLLLDALEMTQEQNKKILVAYNGSAYFIHNCTHYDVELVSISEIYITDQTANRNIHFTPLTVTKVPSSDTMNIKRIMDIVCDEENFVNVAYSEIYSLPTNDMMIVIHGQRIPKMATGRYFLYNKDHYELQ